MREGSGITVHAPPPSSGWPPARLPCGMLLLLSLFSCSGPDDPPGTPPPGTADDTSPTGDTGSASSLPALDLSVVPVQEAPGVVHVRSGSGATDWAVTVGERRFPAGDDGIAAVYGFPQGSVLEALAGWDGEEPEALSLTIPPRPPEWTVEVLDPGRSEVATGLVSVALVGRVSIRPEVLVLQGSDGDVVWWHPIDPAWDVSAAGPNAEGDGFVWLEIDSDRSTSDARMVELTLDGRRYEVVSAPTGHHVGIEPVAGRYAFLELDVREDVVAPDKSLYDPASDKVVEMNADGSSGVELVNVMDQLFQGRNDYPCEHSMVREDAYGHDALNQWTHGNSLVYLPDSDSYLAYLRWTDTLLKVGRDGTLHWTLSGPWSDFTAPDGSPLWLSQDQSLLWSHGHFTDGWEGGLLMYDNGNHTENARVVEVHYDETARTAEVVAE